MAATSVYDTALVFGIQKPNYVAGKGPIAIRDADRVTSYWTYEDIFHNVSSVFSAILRTDDGEEISRRYVPTARAIIEGTNRYLGKGLTWVAMPTDAAGAPVTDEAVAEIMGILNTLFEREEFVVKFLSWKRWGLIRGDSLLHISVDENKPPGSRLRVTEVHPGYYFPIFDKVDAERITGVYLVTPVLDDQGRNIVQRLDYLKTDKGTIFTKLGFFETQGWDDREGGDLAPVDPPASVSAELPNVLAGFELPATITAIPLYHFRNSREGVQPFGVSEIQGIETLIAGINQCVSDEDMTIALTGLGVYWTDSGRPRTPAGQPTDWTIAPATMLELEQGGKIGRLEGVTTIQPMLDHSTYLNSAARQTTGTPDVAVGKVDVAVAQSGVALAIEMAPVTSKNEEKEIELGNKLSQLLFDLVNGWLPAYEGYNPQGVIIQAQFGDPLPVDRKAVLEEILNMVKSQLISLDFARTLITSKLGYTFPADMLAQIASEQAALLDATAGRLADAAGGAPDLGAAGA